MRSIIVRLLDTGADTDLLDGTEIETMPGPGLLTMRAASTVNTATLAVSSSESPDVSQARAITLRANGEIRAYDSAWVMAVKKGERVIVALAGTTGTVFTEFTWVGG